MAETQQVIIEFVTKDDQLEATIDKLEKTGAIDSKLAASFKQTTAEINKQSAAIKNTASATAPLKKNLEDADKAAKQFMKDIMEGAQQGFSDALKEAGVSAEEFTDALIKGQTEAQAPADSLRQRLKNLTQQIAQLKLAGEDNTEQFKALVVEAGNIQDAIGDASAEIRNAGSDTRTFDNLLGTAQAVAGGFAVAQGAAALFGDESEELQKVLLKVNAAMAILQGLQSVSNALQQEGAIIQLFSNKQRIIGNAQLAIENGLQSTSIVTRIAAAAAQRILNAAMAANPIAIFIAALVLVVGAMAAYIKKSRDAEIQTGELNDAVEAATEGFENYARQVKLKSEETTSELEKNGALQSEILQGQLNAEKDINAQRSQEIARLRQFLTTSRDADEKAIEAANERLKQLSQDRAEADVKAVQDQNALTKQLRDENIKSLIASAETELLAAREGSQKQLQLQKQLISLRAQEDLNTSGLTEAEKTAIIAKAENDRFELQKAFDKRRIDIQLKSIEAQLVNVKEGSEEELKLRQQQIKLQVASEITSTKLSEAEKNAIKEKGFQDQLKLQREFNERVRRESIEAQISLNNAQIAQIQTNDEDRLLLQIANIELAASAEVDAAKGNTNKIKEVNAKRDADILAVRKSFIDQAAQYEIDIRTADNGPANRALQRIINDEKKGLQTRITAIRQLTAFQIENINIQLAALEQEKEKKLISEKDYLLKYKQLQDQKAQLTEDSEKETTDMIKEENRKRIETAINIAGQLADVIASINETTAQGENDRLSAQRDEVNALLEAGAITEAEAAKRNKRLDQEEKKLKQQQAQREKNLAVFRAFLAIPQAYLTGLSQGGPIVAAIYAALAAAQAIIIATRPLPRFGHGKKSMYEGPAEVGETGTELYEQNGRMFIADKKQLVWLGAKDKVYNPTETKEMLMPVVDKKVMQWQSPNQTGVSIDYDKLGKAVGKHVNIPGFNIDEEGFKIWEQKGLARKNYMDKRYSSK